MALEKVRFFGWLNDVTVSLNSRVVRKFFVWKAAISSPASAPRSANRHFLAVICGNGQIGTDLTGE
jgi:hypothetical protein